MRSIDETQMIGEAWAHATSLSADGQLQQAIMEFLRLRCGVCGIFHWAVRVMYGGEGYKVPFAQLHLEYVGGTQRPLFFVIAAIGRLDLLPREGLRCCG